MAMPTLIITRPRLQAKPLAERLRVQGINSLIFPLLEIRPFTEQQDLKLAFQDLEKFSLVIFVSPNAIEIAFNVYKEMTSAIWPTPIAVLGPGSIKALNRHGINSKNTRIISPVNLLHTKQDVIEQSVGYYFDSEKLLEALIDTGLDLQTLRGKRVLLIRGMGGRELLAQTLRQAGVDLTIVEIYQRCMPVPNAILWTELKKVIRSPHIWLLTSAEAVKNLSTLRQAQSWLPLTSTLVTHPRIAEIAGKIGFSKISLVDNLDLDDLRVAMLSDWY